MRILLRCEMDTGTIHLATITVMSILTLSIENHSLIVSALQFFFIHGSVIKSGMTQIQL